MIIDFLTLETPRLFLRRLTPEERKYIFDHYDEKSIMDMFGLESKEKFELEKSKHIKGITTYNRSFCLFYLIKKESNEVIGACGFHNWNEDHFRAEIGYHIHKEENKNKGYMTEALKRIIQYGIEELNLHRIEAMVGIFNTPSLKLMEKMGFQKEGLLREHYLIDEKYTDSAFFSLLRSEYIKNT